MRTAPYTHASDGSPCWTGKKCRRNNFSDVIRKRPTPGSTYADSNLSEYGTERIGISAELAVAQFFDIPVTAEYVERGDKIITGRLLPGVGKIFLSNSIPRPVKHVAEAQNPVDFLLENDKTLSVKTNMNTSTKVSPQKIGQPSARTFWKEFKDLAPDGVDTEKLSYKDSAKLFKKTAIENAPVLLERYWKNLFDCDHLIYINNVRTDLAANSAEKIKVYNKESSPKWDPTKITFSQTADSWNESCTVKYDGHSIGEWQVHTNRDNFKFRFILKGLDEAGLL